MPTVHTNSDGTLGVSGTLRPHEARKVAEELLEAAKLVDKNREAETDHPHVSPVDLQAMDAPVTESPDDQHESVHEHENTPASVIKDSGLSKEEREYFLINPDDPDLQVDKRKLVTDSPTNPNSAKRGSKGGTPDDPKAKSVPADDDQTNAAHSPNVMVADEASPKPSRQPRKRKQQTKRSTKTQTVTPKLKKGQTDANDFETAEHKAKSLGSSAKAEPAKGK